jgi:hypothetical protein
MSLARTPINASRGLGLLRPPASARMLPIAIAMMTSAPRRHDANHFLTFQFDVSAHGSSAGRAARRQHQHRSRVSQPELHTSAATIGGECAVVPFAASRTMLIAVHAYSGRDGFASLNRGHGAIAGGGPSPPPACDHPLGHGRYPATALRDRTTADPSVDRPRISRHALSPSRSGSSSWLRAGGGATLRPRVPSSRSGSSSRDPSRLDWLVVLLRRQVASCSTSSGT